MAFVVVGRASDRVERQKGSGTSEEQTTRLLEKLKPVLDHGVRVRSPWT